jgi:hypothetical protein
MRRLATGLSNPVPYSIYFASTTTPVRVRVTLRLEVYRQSVRLAVKPLETHDSSTEHLRLNPYATSSLTRGRVCCLQSLLVLVSVVIKSSEPRVNHDHILLPQIGDSPNMEGQVPVFISPRNRVARLYAQTLGSLFIVSYDSQGSTTPVLPNTSYKHFARTRWKTPSSTVQNACLLVR